MMVVSGPIGRWLEKGGRLSTQQIPNTALSPSLVLTEFFWSLHIGILIWQRPILLLLQLAGQQLVNFESSDKLWIELLANKLLL